MGCISSQIMFTVGYSWIDAGPRMVLTANSGVGVNLAWKRALLVIIGFTAAFIVMCTFKYAIAVRSYLFTVDLVSLCIRLSFPSCLDSQVFPIQRSAGWSFGKRLQPSSKICPNCLAKRLRRSLAKLLAHSLTLYRQARSSKESRIATRSARKGDSRRLEVIGWLLRYVC